MRGQRASAFYSHITARLIYRCGFCLSGINLANGKYNPAQSRHTRRGRLRLAEQPPNFSFGAYSNPDRIHFGALRVLNDDIVAAGGGFGAHPHDNMEIISIALEGELEHKDSMGNTRVIRQGDVQVMSAGTGIRHSEYNKNADRPVKFLQIWVIPKERNVQPRYDQISLAPDATRNKLLQILSPADGEEGVWIHQDAWFHLGRFDRDFSTTYSLKKQGNGIYAFVLSGAFNVAGQTLAARDGFGIWDIETLEIKAESQDAEILLMEVPMELS